MRPAFLYLQSIKVDRRRSVPRGLLGFCMRRLNSSLIRTCSEPVHRLLRTCFQPVPQRHKHLPPRLNSGEV
jgi:hypothetical protein